MVENGSPSYVSMKHGNGMDCDAIAKFASVADFTDITLETGAFGIWIKPLYSSAEVNTTVVWEIGTNAANKVRFNLAYQGGAVNQYVFLIHEGGVVRGNCNTGALSWSADELHHVACVWDKDAAGDKVEIYWDNSKVSTIVTNLDWTATGSWVSPNPFYLGKSVIAFGAKTADAGIDTPKIWSYKKTDFADKEVERAGLNDVVS